MTELEITVKATLQALDKSLQQEDPGTEHWILNRACWYAVSNFQESGIPEKLFLKGSFNGSPVSRAEIANLIDEHTSEEFYNRCFDFAENC